MSSYTWSAPTLTHGRADDSEADCPLQLRGLGLLHLTLGQPDASLLRIKGLMTLIRLLLLLTTVTQDLNWNP